MNAIENYSYGSLVWRNRQDYVSLASKPALIGVVRGLIPNPVTFCVYSCNIYFYNPSIEIIMMLGWI
jgi:hypothetical protein